ncbi:MAG: hypothetical protein ABIS67_13325 [Candidatus Eisenbacteria bacterium]
MIRHVHPDTAELRAWAARIAVRRGRRIAAVAPAHRLAGILGDHCVTLVKRG